MAPALVVEVEVEEVVVAEEEVSLHIIHALLTIFTNNFTGC